MSQEWIICVELPLDVLKIIFTKLAGNELKTLAKIYRVNKMTHEIFKTILTEMTSSHLKINVSLMYISELMLATNKNFRTINILCYLLQNNFTLVDMIQNYLIHGKATQSIRLYVRKTLSFRFNKIISAETYYYRVESENLYKKTSFYPIFKIKRYVRKSNRSKLSLVMTKDYVIINPDELDQRVYTRADDYLKYKKFYDYEMSDYIDIKEWIHQAN